MIVINLLEIQKLKQPLEQLTTKFVVSCRNLTYLQLVRVKTKIQRKAEAEAREEIIIARIL